MGIVKNNKNIIAIYRGDKKITSVFKNNLKIFEINDEPVVFDNIINSKLKTTSANQSRTLTSKQEYFDSIIVDGETELVSGGTGSLSYIFPNVGTHTVKYKVKDNINDISRIFYNSSYITEIDANSLDTSNATNMSESFSFCDNLMSLNLSNWNTSKVTNMSGMFRGCYDLTSLDVSNFNTSKVTDMNSMFAVCQSLTSLDVSNFNTSKVTNMESMFVNCRSLTSLDVSNFNTSKVTDMNSMFYNCSGLTSLDLSSFDTSNVTDMEDMFFGCTNLESLNLKKFDTNTVTSYSNMFSASNNLNYIKCTQTFKNWCLFNQSEISLPSAMQENGGGTWDIYSNAEIKFAFGSILLTSKKEYFSSIKNASKDEELDVSGNGELSISTFGSVDIKYTFKEGLTDLISCFANCNNLDSIDLSDVSFASINDISGLFEGCTSIKTISFKNEDLSHISNYTNAFANCNSLSKIICTESTMNWIKEHSTEMGLNDTMINGTMGKYGRKTNWELYDYVPSGGQSLKILSDYPGEQIKITNSQEKFNSITVDGMPLDVSGNGELRFEAQRDGEIIADFSLKTDQIDYPGLFKGCDKIMEVDLSGFDFSNALNCDDMFSNCNRLQKVYFPDNIERLESMSIYIFYGCNELQTIRCTRRMKDWFFENPDRFQLPDSLRHGSEGPVDSGSNWELYDY